MTLDELKKAVKAGNPPEIEVRSVELALFVLYSMTAGERQPLLDARGGSLSFPSRFAALQALAGTGLEQVHVVHVSPYDEMVGLQSVVGQSEMRERVSLTAYA